MTPIEWLKKELEEYGSSSHLNLDWDTFDKLCEQAKQMEAEQIKIPELSDEEIKNIVDKIYPNPNGSSKLLVSGFIQGCRWYREQLNRKIMTEKDILKLVKETFDEEISTSCCETLLGLTSWFEGEEEFMKRLSEKLKLLFESCPDYKLNKQFCTTKI